MSDSTPATAGSHQEEPVDGDYFAPLASAKHMLLTTFKPDGGQASVVVRGGVVDGRAYVWTWSRPDAMKHLRHTDEVQVAPCAARGLLCLAPPLDATARLLPDEEASQVARKLSRKSQVRRHFPTPLLHPVHRARHRQRVYYELLAYEAEPAVPHGRGAFNVPGRSAADPRGKEPGAHQITVVRSSAPFPWPR